MISEGRNLAVLGVFATLASCAAAYSESPTTAVLDLRSKITQLRSIRAGRGLLAATPALKTEYVIAVDGSRRETPGTAFEIVLPANNGAAAIVLPSEQRLKLLGATAIKLTQEQMPIPLNKLFNCDGVSRDNEPSAEGGMPLAVLKKRASTSGPVFESLGGTWYLMPPVATGQNNMVACTEQRIPLPDTQDLESVRLLLMSMNGELETQLNVVSGEGATTLTHQLKIPDWSTTNGGNSASDFVDLANLLTELAEGKPIKLTTFSLEMGPGAKATRTKGTFSPGFVWTGEKTEIKLRTTLDLPVLFKDRDVRHGEIVATVGIDDKGRVRANGGKWNDFWQGEGRIVIATLDNRPRIVQLEIEGRNETGIGKFLKAELHYEIPAVRELAEIVMELQAFTHLAKALPGGQEKLNRAIEALDQFLPVKAIAEQDYDALSREVKKLREALTEIAPWIKQHRVELAGYSHIDLSWLWPLSETIDSVIPLTFWQALHFMEEFPNFKFSMTQAQQYEWVEKTDPVLFRKIGERVETGQWELLGGMWCEPDCNLPSGESLVRQILYGKRYFKETFGYDCRVGMNPDSFGYTWQLPQIYKKAGFDAFVTQKISWNDTWQFPYKLFWWESPDGTRLLSYFPVGGYNEGLKLDTTAEQLAKFEEMTTGIKEMLVIYGVGDHGGGPTREMIRRGVRMAQSSVLPETRMSRMDSYFTGLKSKGIVGDPAAPVKNSSISNPDSGELPVWADELYLEKHRGAYTTHADAKDGNRRSERLMYSAELAASLAWLGEPGTKTADSSDESATTRPAILTNSPPGIFPITPAEQLHPALLGDVSAETSYPIQLFTKAWKDICLLQMHDILPGSGIHVNYEEAARLYRDLQSSVTESLAASLPRLLPATTHENTSGPVNYVFNLLPWERTGICLVPAEGMDTAELLDGKPLPTQRWPDDPTKLAVAITVPACGYQTIQLAKVSTTSTVIITTDTLENEFMRVRVDTRTGNLASVIEKSTGREMLGQYTTGSRVIKMPSQKYEATDESLLVSTTASLQGNILQAHGDYPMAYDAWEISMSGAVNELTTGVEVGAVTSGTLFADLPITRTLNKSTFKQTYRLYAGVPWLDVLSDMDWHERHTLLKAAFPLSLNNRSADYEIPFAAISRPAVRTKPEEIGKYEHCGIQWANYDDASGDAGFALLTNNKYGFDATDNVLRLTLLRGPDSPNQAADAGKPLTDEGRHVFSYGIFPHGGTWQQADVVRYGYEYNHSFISVQGPPPETTTTTGKSFLAVSPSNVMLASVKKAEDDDSVILRFYEAEGEPSTAAQITLPWKIEKVDNCDLLERTDTPVVQLQKAATVTSNTLQFQIGRHEIATYKLTLGE